MFVCSCKVCGKVFFGRKEGGGLKSVGGLLQQTLTTTPTHLHDTYPQHHDDEDDDNLRTKCVCVVFKHMVYILCSDGMVDPRSAHIRH